MAKSQASSPQLDRRIRTLWWRDALPPAVIAEKLLAENLLPESMTADAAVRFVGAAIDRLRESLTPSQIVKASNGGADRRLLAEKEKRRFVERAEWVLQRAAEEIETLKDGITTTNTSYSGGIDGNKEIEVKRHVTLAGLRLKAMARYLDAARDLATVEGVNFEPEIPADDPKAKPASTKRYVLGLTMRPAAKRVTNDDTKTKPN